MTGSSVDSREGTPNVRRLRVSISAGDELNRAGLIALLSRSTHLAVRPDQDDVAPDVMVVAPVRRPQEPRGSLSARTPRSPVPIILVADEVSTSDLIDAVCHGVRAVLPRAMVNPEVLDRCVTAVASGAAIMSPDLIGDLLRYIVRLHGAGGRIAAVDAARLTKRDIEVLQLLAEGLNTADIAAALRYSSRTVKNVIHQIMQRLDVRNRPHAVAYAVRTGLI
ncbi:response regulator transcription factor [Actinoplanes sp. NPDC049548]|uniref:helix-turn-helix transcriptional regulator n=1 Tax=Actinoplanes sp. NPDC049548 TaxID=3155152 RepID=UPI0034382FF4